MKLRIQDSCDTVEIQVACIDQNIFFTIAMILVLTAAVLMKEDLTTDLFGTMSVFIAGIFLHKSIVWCAAGAVCKWNDLLCFFCIIKRIGINFFIHTTGTFIFLAVIGKKYDFFAGVGIIIKYAGIIRDQRITDTQSLISIPGCRKWQNMMITGKIFQTMKERMQFNKKNLILIQLGIPQRKILRERLHISLIVQSIKITTESRKVGKQFFALQTDLLF